MLGDIWTDLNKKNPMACMALNTAKDITIIPCPSNALTISLTVQGSSAFIFHPITKSLTDSVVGNTVHHSGSSHWRRIESDAVQGTRLHVYSNKAVSFKDDSGT